MEYLKHDNHSCTYRISFNELEKMVHIANYVANYFDDHDQFLLEVDKDSILSARKQLTDVLSQLNGSDGNGVTASQLDLSCTTDPEDIFIVDSITGTNFDLRIGHKQKSVLFTVCSYPADTGHIIAKFNPAFSIDTAHEIADGITEVAMARLAADGISIVSHFPKG